MKKQVLTLLAATVLAGGALIATGTVASTTAYAEAPLETTGNFQEYAFGKVVTVTNAKGAQVYSDQALTKPIAGKVLPKGSRWQAPREVLSTGDVNYLSYRLGGNQYVKGSDVAGPAGSVNLRGVFTVNVPSHPTWGTAVYDGNLKPLRILPAKSKWQVYAIYTVDKVDYYDLGGGQYIKAGNGTFVPHY